MAIELQVGVKILLTDQEGKYLLLRRSAEKYPEMPIRWDIPGGRIDTGKTLRENLERELKEETGFVLSGGPKLIAAQDILRVEGRHVVRLTYLGEGSGEPTLSDEHDTWKWVTFREMRDDPDLDIYLRELTEDGTIA